MFNTSNGYSLSDIAAVSRNGGDEGWGGGNGAWWLIVLFLFAFNGNGWGWGGNREGGGAAPGTVREEVAYGFDMNGLENGVRGIQQGLCDGFYAMNTGMLNGFSGIQNTLCQGFAGVHDSITQGTIADMQGNFALQSAITAGNTGITAQLTNMAAANAACCCETQRGIERGFADLGYNLATQACDTRRAIADSTRDIIDFLTQDKLATLQAENQTLKFAASQQAQNNYLVNALRDPCPVPAYVVPNPNCCYPYANVAFGFNNCGC
jgi:hypothetical protein